VFLAALLTVIGYSVNDSVVVFDRVRELRGRREPFARTVGKAVLQTLPRTVNTGIGVLFVLGALLLLGDGSLADFALVLLLGLVTGTVSTVATAGPVAILLDRRNPGASRPAQRKPRDRTDSGAVV
jgi:SecD/SecF fusion protein